jgi:glycosyltransferase involved in cell wall biosynthesis
VTVAVVIPCRNEAARIADLLTSLRDQSRRPDTTVIVDDQSTDTTYEVIADWCLRYPDMPVKVMLGPGRGPGPALNVGIAATHVDVIVRMDGHARPDPYYIERALIRLQEDEAGVVGGRWVVRHGAETPVARAIAAVVASPLGAGGARYRSAGAGAGVHVVETVPFGVFHRALWLYLDGFDERLEANQDFDFNFRARQAGYRVVFDAGIQAEYFARPTLGALWRQYRRYGFWKARMLRKNVRALHPRQVPPIALLPWLMATAGGVLVAPNMLTLGAVLVWPAMVGSAAVLVAVRRRVSPLEAMRALLAVHVAWSVGFWHGVVARQVHT